jgi:hypothetical protein
MKRIAFLLPLVAMAACGSTATGGGATSAPAPQAASITGEIAPRTTVVGAATSLTFDLSGFNENVPNFGIDTSGDLQDHYTIDSVTLALNGGSASDRTVDPNASSDYLCGAVPKADKAEIVISAVPKNAGNFSVGVLFVSGALGSNDFATFGGNNSDMAASQAVNS